MALERIAVRPDAYETSSTARASKPPGCNLAHLHAKRAQQASDPILVVPELVDLELPRKQQCAQLLAWPRLHMLGLEPTR